MRKQAKLAKGRFTGDPSYEYEHVEIKKIYGEGDEVQEEEETVSVRFSVYSFIRSKLVFVKRSIKLDY